MSAFHYYYLITNFSDSFAAEKKELINDIVSLKKNLSRKELDHTRKCNENTKMKSDFDTTVVTLNESTNKLNQLKEQVCLIFIVRWHSKD